MVQKVAMLGAPMIIAVSAPTAEAVALAEAAGITLIALAAGGYVAKRYIDRREQAKTGSDQRSADPE
jgi:formate dehydrogenase accessory protein FdhD